MDAGTFQSWLEKEESELGVEPDPQLPFRFGPTPPCFNAADCNDDGAVDIADAIALVSHLFAGAGSLPEPFGACGIDPTVDDLGCESFPPCE